MTDPIFRFGVPQKLYRFQTLFVCVFVLFCWVFWVFGVAKHPEKSQAETRPNKKKHIILCCFTLSACQHTCSFFLLVVAPNTTDTSFCFIYSFCFAHFVLKATRTLLFAPVLTPRYTHFARVFLLGLHEKWLSLDFSLPKHSKTTYTFYSQWS